MNPNWLANWTPWDIFLFFAGTINFLVGFLPPIDVFSCFDWAVSATCFLILILRRFENAGNQ